MTAAALAIATATAFAGGAQASTLQLFNITASWVNPQGGSAVVTSDANTLTPSIRWGTPAGGSPGKSGYDLTILGDPVPVPGAEVDSVFDVAEFTHINNPIQSGGGIDSVELEVAADIRLGTETQVTGAMFKFLFDHDETPNTAANCPGEPADTRCADIVTTSLLEDTSTFTLDGTVYTLTILGFLNSSGEFTSQFISPEGGSNTGIVQASFSAAPIPLPAAGWMLLAGIGGLAAMRRRKKA